MGPLKLIHDLPEDFLIMNGDVISDLDYSWFYNFHKNAGEIFTIGAFSRTEVSEYGVLKTDTDNILTGFMEKPKSDITVSMGIYMAKREILNHIPADIAYGFDKLMIDLLSKQRKVLIHKHMGYWLDIGRPDDYMKAIDDLEILKEKIMPWE
jgi:NDP-sugar pyrophosphorylase family protein